MKIVGPLSLLVAPVMVAAIVPAMVSAQLMPGSPLQQGLPSLPPVEGLVRGVTDDVAALPRAVVQLATDRLARIDGLIRDYPAEIARDEHGDPSRAGEIIVEDADEALIAAADKSRFVLIERSTIGGLDIGYARFRTPTGKSLPAAIKAMRKIAGKRAVSADQLHFQSGEAGARGENIRSGGPEGIARIGMIDGSPTIAGTITRAGFARGAGNPSNHGSAVASLMLGTPRVRGAAPGARLWAADVYGTDPAGGNALAIARAIGWLAAQRVPVIVISLVGPANPLLARVVRAVQARGIIIVAAVGNDGAAAPPSYPASYPGVIAVTGIDARNRVLIEAGRALHLDYAAPGADMMASDASGGAVAVRGTSFAAPLVAARIALAYHQADPARIAATLRLITGEARRMGPRYGQGIVCGHCPTPTR